MQAKNRIQPSLSIWGTTVYAILSFRYRKKSISKAPAELLLPACPALSSLIPSLEQVTADLDFPSTQWKTMDKKTCWGWLLLLAPLKQDQCHSTHMSMISHRMTPQSPFSTHPTSPSQTQPCCHLLLQRARGQQPAESARGKSSFLPYFPSSKGEWGLERLVGLIKEQCKAFTLLKLKIKLIFHHAFIREIQDRKDTAVTTQQAKKKKF